MALAPNGARRVCEGAPEPYPTVLPGVPVLEAPWQGRRTSGSGELPVHGVVAGHTKYFIVF